MISHLLLLLTLLKTPIRSKAAFQHINQQKYEVSRIKLRISSNGEENLSHSIPDETITQHENNNSDISRRNFMVTSAAASAGILSSFVPVSNPSNAFPVSRISEAEKTVESSININTNMIISSSSKSLQEAISGFFAGAALSTTKTIVKYPLDTATVRLQMKNSTYSILNPSTLFQGSFNGIATPLLSNIPAGAVFFATKDATKSFLKENLVGVPKWVTTSIAVAAALPPYWIIRNPSEVVKTRQQAKLEGYGDDVNALDAYRNAYKQHQARENTDSSFAGIKGFYTGYSENVVYGLPADVIKFIAYENLTQGRKNLSPIEGAFSGAVATAIAQLVTTPLDVVRNRVMTSENTKDSSSATYWQNLVTIYEGEGVKGLFAGSSPRVGKAILSGAIQFATYEETKSSISKLFNSPANR